MKVILLDNINGLGKTGDVKNVSDGYATNFLLPKKLAVAASPANLEYYRAQAATAEKVIAQKISAYQKIKKILDKQVFEFTVKVSDKGHLFKAINNKDVIEAVKSKFNLDLDKKWFKNPVALKDLGQHNVILQLPDDLQISVVIKIRPQD
jgi:large subunit ribosomal protein L9